MADDYVNEKLNDIHQELYSLRQETSKALFRIRTATDDYLPNALTPHGNPATLNDIYRELYFLRQETTKELTQIRIGLLFLFILGVGLFWRVW